MTPSVEAFDKAKYKALMDGLECSEIQFSAVSSTITLRYDSDYYSKENTAIESFIANNPSRFTTLAEMGLSADASAFYPSLEPFYNTGDIPFIRVADVKSTIDYDNCVKIPKMGDRFSTLNLCHPGDIVLTKGGRVGTAGLISKESYVTRDLIFINSSILEHKDAVMLYLYYSTYFAQKLMLRSSSMTAQPHLTVTLIKDLSIFVFSDSFKRKIVNIFDDSAELLCKSGIEYKAAADLFDDCFKAPSISNDSNSYIRSLSSSYAVYGRLDAEYYQPKYEEITKSISPNRKVSKLCNLYEDNYVPDATRLYSYIELANIGKSGEILDVELHNGYDLPTRARRKVKAGQVIISSVEGSLQSCSLITEEYDGALCSTGFYVLDSDYINSETLLILFKSDPIQALLKQRCSGSILSAINKDELLSMLLPEVNSLVQAKIAAKVHESFELRSKSKKLLEFAKQAVDMAIKKDESVAIAWLNEKLSEQED